jgi:long-chain-alcohol oxidase
MEGKTGNIRRGHPLLRGKKREKGEYTHGFSQAQIQSLSAICATFIPSVPMEDIHVSNGKEGPPSKALQEFYTASGADFNIPDEVPLIKISSIFFILGLICFVPLKF